MSDGHMAVGEHSFPLKNVLQQGGVPVAWEHFMSQLLPMLLYLVEMYLIVCSGDSFVGRSAIFSLRIGSMPLGGCVHTHTHTHIRAS